MAFDIETEKRNLDLFSTWYTLQYSDIDGHMCEGCTMSCGCKINEAYCASSLVINKVYSAFIEEHLTSQTKLGRARQAFWANIEFCKLFHEYFWMDYDMFEYANHYYPWRSYCVDSLGLYIDLDKDERKWNEYFPNLMEKYVSWPEPIITTADPF